MHKLHITIWMLLLSTLLSATHNFTINGENETTVSIGDTLEVYFEFEASGNSASYSVSIDLLGVQLPGMQSEDEPLIDGGIMDETGIDGVFLKHMSNFISIPEAASIIITITDQDVSDSVILHYEQLQTDFSISGNVNYEGQWIDPPVIGGFVYCFYNVSPLEMVEIFQDFDLAVFLDYMSQGHYLLSDTTGLFGDYQIFVPEDIPDVSCMVGVNSLLDAEGSYISPGTQMVTVNGHITDVDMIYLIPDGYFAGSISDSLGNPLSNAAVFVSDLADSTFFMSFYADSLGAFSKAMQNGSYWFRVNRFPYTSYENTFIISDSNYYEDIVLEGDSLIVPTDPTTPEGIEIVLLEHQVLITWNSVGLVDGYTVYSCSTADGEYEEDLTGVYMGTAWRAPYDGERRFYRIVSFVADDTRRIEILRRNSVPGTLYH